MRAYLLHSLYGPHVQPFRLELSQNQVWQFLNEPDPVVLELFLIEYCALGVAMTQPVEDWIRRAAERCEVLSFAEVGRFLIAHANEKKDEYMAFVEDTRWLVNRWNAKHERQLDAEKLLTQPPTAGVMNYRALHEAIISGDAPYCQLAIEFEIERLSSTYGAAAIPKIVRVLGPQTITGLQFLKNRVIQGDGYTLRAEDELNKVLHDVPSALPLLTETAGSALKLYSEYLSDCLSLASKEAALDSIDA